MSAQLRRTPLYDEHRRLGARLVPFAGYEMPVLYRSVIDEHRAVRQRAGLFDVSHMGEIAVEGPAAREELQSLVTNDVGKLRPGRAQYNCLLDEDGGLIDDLLVYMLAQDRYLLVVNAGPREGDLAIIRDHCRRSVVRDESDETALLALQGPRAVDILRPLCEVDLDAVRYYRFVEGRVDGVEAIISRTGYTGEDGFELYVGVDEAARLWRRLLASEVVPLVPVGLGARDTLRLEAGMLLSGTDFDRRRTPLEAGLDFVVKLDKGPFRGRDALVEQQRRGVETRLVGLEIVGRGIARQGYEIRHGGAVVGEVTSGTMAPTLSKAIALGYVPAALAEVGTELEVSIRRRPVAARVVSIPFYRRPR